MGGGRLTNSVARFQRRAGPTVGEQPLAATAGPARHGEGEVRRGVQSPLSHRARKMPPGVGTHSLAGKRRPVLNKQTRPGVGSRPGCLLAPFDPRQSSLHLMAREEQGIQISRLA